MPATLFKTIFHEAWWLDAVTNGNWAEAVVESNGATIARLPYSIKRGFGVTGLAMPPLTHTLGPQFLYDPLAETQRSNNREAINELVSKLPRHDFFNQICDPYITDAFGFYLNGYDSGINYTLRVSHDQTTEVTWSRIRPAMRRAIRKAESRVSVEHLPDVHRFCHFYNSCVRANHKVFWTNRFENGANKIKKRLFEACCAHNAGCILVAKSDDDVIRAGVMLVWDDHTMYYILTAHDADPAGAGGVKLLVWEALKMAHQKGLTFDFDGFPRPEAANFLTGFGGKLQNRICITKASPTVLFTKMLASRLRLGI